MVCWKKGCLDGVLPITLIGLALKGCPVQPITFPECFKNEMTDLTFFCFTKWNSAVVQENKNWIEFEEGLGFVFGWFIFLEAMWLVGNGQLERTCKMAAGQMSAPATPSGRWTHLSSQGQTTATPYYPAYLCAAFHYMQMQTERKWKRVSVVWAFPSQEGLPASCLVRWPLLLLLGCFCNKEVQYLLASAESFKFEPQL